MELDLLTDEEHALLAKTPERGFLPRFEKWAAMKTDAPSYTLKAAALQALSLACGDQVVLGSVFDDKPMYLNLYILIVGPSTTMRKTTVLNYIRGILPVNMQTGTPYITFLDDISTQAFNKTMGKAGKTESPVIFSVDEIAGLFQTVRKKNSFLSGFDKVLLTAFDHSPISIIRTNSDLEVPTGAFVNIFAASTPDPLMEVLASEDVESGLLPRFLIFDARGAARRKRISLMDRRKNSDEWDKLKEALKEYLYTIAKNRADGIPNGGDGESVTFPKTYIEMTEEAEERLDLVDVKFHAEASEDSSAMGAIKGRALWHMYKLSALYAISRSGLNAKVEVIDALRAIRLVEDTTKDLAVMQEEVGANALERNIRDILNAIEMSGGRIAQGQLTKQMKLSYQDANLIGKTMKMRELIEIEKNGDRVYWKAAG